MHLTDDQRYFARQLRRHSTEAEARIWYHLRGRRLRGLRFRRQHPVAGYFADFACLELHLIIELDGGQHDLRREHDLMRADILAANGFEVLRFWNNDVLANTAGVLAAIAARAEQIQGSRKTDPDDQKSEALTRAMRDLSR